MLGINGPKGPKFHLSRSLAPVQPAGKMERGFRGCPFPCETPLHPVCKARELNESRVQKGLNGGWEQLGASPAAMWRRVSPKGFLAVMPGHACSCWEGGSVKRFGCRVSGFGFRVSGFGFRVSGFGVWGFRFRVSGFGVGVLSCSAGERWPYIIPFMVPPLARRAIAWCGVQGLEVGCGV